ncbi:uncharacterized protein LOC144475855 isoform X1 [Augochlora pura]
MTESSIEDSALDIELFIEEVKKFPEIWNVAAEEYHDRTKKRSAWLEICRIFYDKFDERHERDKNEICNKLIKKWRNVKDNFLKSVKKRTRSGHTAERGRRYIYARQLTFLQQAGIAIKQCSLEDPDEQQFQDETEIKARPDLPYKHNTRKRKHDTESTITELTKTTIPSQSESDQLEYNADKSFFDSLIPSLSGFSEDQKLEFRIEILNIIKRMRQQNSASSNTSPYRKRNGYT